MGLAIGFTLQEEDVGLFGKAVNDGVSGSVAMEDLVPFGKWFVGSDNDGPMEIMSSGDNLEKEIGLLEGHGEVSQLVDDEESRCGKFFNDRFESVDLIGGDKFVEHGRAGSEQDGMAALASSITKSTGEVGFAEAGITDKDDANGLADVVGLEELRKSSADFFSRGIVLEVEGVDGLDAHKGGAVDTALDGTFGPDGKFLVSHFVEGGC